MLQIYQRNPLNYAFNLDLSALLLRTVPEWLEKEVLPKTTHDFALGEETYREMLRTQEQFTYSIDQLLTLGREELARLQEERGPDPGYVR